MKKESKTESERDDERPDTPPPQPQADGSPRAGAPRHSTAGERDEDERGSDDGDAERHANGSDTLRREVEEQRDKYLRLAAEFDNFRKRTSRERQESGARAQADLVRQLLDPLDDLGRVTSLDPVATEAGTVIEGVEMVERKLFKALVNAGLEVLNPVDETFNPELHEAVSTTAALSAEDDSMVAVVYQQGYVFNGQLIRPARVVVKQWNG